MNDPEHADIPGRTNRATDASMVIHLHVAIPSVKEDRVIHSSFFETLKKAVHRILDWSRWLLHRKFQFKSHNYAQREYSNRGDIAIKLVIKELLQAQFSGVELIFSESEWGKLSETAVRRINEHSSLFVIAGGGYWVFNKSKKISPAFLADLPYFNQVKCPLVVFGSGVNFNMPEADSSIDVDIDPQLRAALLDFDRRVDLFAVRCRSSFNFFQSLGLQNARLLCDPAVFKSMSGEFPKHKNNVLSIGLNFAFHGKFVESLLARNILIYIEFLKIVSQHFKAKFYYFIHSDEEFLVAKILQSAGVKLTVVDVSANDLANAYRQVDVLICQMMHSNILSFCAGVPALNIAYDSKNIGFNDLIGMQEFCVSAHLVTVESLVEKMTKLIQSRTTLSQNIATKKATLAIEMQNFMRDLGDIVANYPNNASKLAKLAGS
ncbi:polysaccharide pyruvyl transferase family protein [Undibacterium sp. SXout20W]|uniref:polysaccharide pyruvyl transferase family protein n=1 Tax=Undibacterium sp. SXout20W TaxID=3413051 RepID=UPI003BF14671